MMTKRLDILLIEDNPGDARLIQEYLSDARNTCWTLEHRETLGQGLERLAAGGIDVVLLDLTLPDSAGLDTVRRAHRAAPHVPLVVLTGLDDDAVGYDAVRSGAQDYLTKDRAAPDLLTRVIQYAIERQKTQAALMQSEMRVRKIIEHNADGILVIGPDSRILFANTAAAALLGRPGQDLAGTPFEFPLEQGRTMEIDVPGDPDAERCVEVSVAAMDWEGAPAHLASLRDVTDRRQAMRDNEQLQEQLLHAQKMEAIGLLAGGVAHDFNNMLTAILGNAFLAKRQQEQDIPCTRELMEITCAAERAGELTSKLLTFARKEKLNVRANDLETMLQNVRAILEHSVHKKITIRTVFEPGIPPVNADANQMHQALLNICNNAADAMPHGGTLTLTTRRMLADQAFCKTHAPLRPGPCGVVEISDTGVGIPEKFREKIFEPFFTTKGADKGTGLGLSVTHGIIANHDGHIEVDSRDGQGTVFRIFLPAAQPPAPDCAAPAPEELLKGTETVLVVDDEAPVLESVTRTLDCLGYTVIPAGSGSEALDIVAGRRVHVDLVLLDMIMPGMDGPEVFGALRDLAPELPVLLCTGFSAEGAATELLRHGARGLVQKPFSLITLSRSLRAALDADFAPQPRA